MTRIEDIGKVLEILGGLLLASSLVGDNRLAVWEAKIARWFSIKIAVDGIHRTMTRIKVEAQQILTIALAVPICAGWVAFYVWCVSKVWAELWKTTKLGFFLQLIETILDIIVPLVFFGVGFIAAVFLAPGHILTMLSSWAMAWLLYVFGTLPAISAYLVTILLLSPYLLAAQVKNRLRLRSTLGVLGVGLVIIGQVLGLGPVRQWLLGSE